MSILSNRFILPWRLSAGMHPCLAIQLVWVLKLRRCLCVNTSARRFFRSLTVNHTALFGSRANYLTTIESIAIIQRAFTRFRSALGSSLDGIRRISGRHRPDRCCQLIHSSYFRIQDGFKFFEWIHQNDTIIIRYILQRAIDSHYTVLHNYDAPIVRQTVILVGGMRAQKI